MAQANTNPTTRRHFAKLLAALPVAAASFPTKAAKSDDAELLELEERIGTLYGQARAMRPAVDRATKVLFETYPEHLWSNDSASTLIKTPESKHQSSLVTKQDDLYGEGNDLIDRMWSITARTVAGKQAKLRVLKDVIWTDGWYDSDEDADWHTLMIRRLLAELCEAYSIPI